MGIGPSGVFVNFIGIGVGIGIGIGVGQWKSTIKVGVSTIQKYSSLLNSL